LSHSTEGEHYAEMLNAQTTGTRFFVTTLWFSIGLYTIMYTLLYEKELQEKDFVGYNEYLKNKNRMNEMLYNNWKFIHEKSVVKVVTGLSLILMVLLHYQFQQEVFH